jgi:hypothetical protein
MSPWYRGIILRYPVRVFQGIRSKKGMVEPVSNEELEQLLEPVSEYEKGLLKDRVGWPVVIDYQTFCSRLIACGFKEMKLAQAKAALIEAELAYRYCGKKSEKRA